MTALAHVGPVPLEETVAIAPVIAAIGGGYLAALRARMRRNEAGWPCAVLDCERRSYDTSCRNEVRASRTPAQDHCRQGVEGCE